MARFSKFQVTTTFCRHPIAPPSKISLTRCHEGSSGKLKSMMVGQRLLRAESRIICAPARSPARGFSRKTGFPSSRARCDGGLEIGRYRDGDHRNGALFDQCLPMAEPPRDIRGSSELRRARPVGSRKCNNLAAGVVAKCRDKDGSPRNCIQRYQRQSRPLSPRATTEDPLWSFLPLSVAPLPVDTTSPTSS